MDKNIGIEVAWLTVNQFCNFRCVWCYAAGTEYKIENKMSLTTAFHLVDLCSSIGVKSVVIIGGEPTFWPYLFDIIRYIKSKNMKASIVTNGFLLSKENFIKKLKESGLDYISFSLKAGNKRQYLELTQNDVFDKVCKGIELISKSGIETDISITISSLVSENLVEVVQAAADNGNLGVSLQLCTPVFDGEKPNKGYTLSPNEYVKIITEAYPKIAQITSDNVWLEQSLPKCIWPTGFLNELERKNQVGYGCHVINREGIIFNTEGSIIPCNCLGGIKFGQIDKDFYDENSLIELWQHEGVVDFYDRFNAYPTSDCGECSEYKNCGGGCPLNWFVFDPKEIVTKY